MGCGQSALNHDLSFKTLNPDVYKEISKSIKYPMLYLTHDFCEHISHFNHIIPGGN